MGIVIGLDDVVNVDGVVGYVDFIGADIIVLIDESGREHRIERLNVREVELLQRNDTNELARMSYDLKKTSRRTG